MKSWAHLSLSLLAIFAVIALVGCEGDEGPAGPAGPPGEDGESGVNGRAPAVCLECHTDTSTLQVSLEYVQSGHYAGNYVSYAGGRDRCAQCHSKQGFVEYAINGSVSMDIPDPSPIDCSACHSVHPDEFLLRLVDPVTAIFDDTTVIDLGDNSNLCANCHQSRRAEPNVSDPGDTFEITSVHYGPHHGPQAIILAGVGMAEIAASTDYPNPGAGHLAAGVTCVACHMADYTEGVGGHTWNPSPEACSCHGNPGDFDIGGFQTEVQAKLDQLQARLLELGVIEYVEEDEAYEPVLGTYPMAQAQAFFNWIGIAEDRSLGVHNPSYVEALLDNSIEAIAPTP